MIEIANTFFSLATIFGQILIIYIFALLWFKKRLKNALFLAFLVTLGVTLGSLFYSEIAGYEPCKLCWFQRIFLFPQVIILGLALFGKAADVKNIIIALSVFGALFAVYHNLLLAGFVNEGWCASTAVSCTQNFVFAFGYITIPVMSLTAFLLIIALMTASSKTENGNGHK